MYFMYPPPNNHGPDSVAQFERMMKIMERMATKETRKKIKKEEEEKQKKKEEEEKKKKEQAKGRNFSPLEWFLLMIVTYPLIGPLYLSLIKYSWNQTLELFK